MTVRHKENSIYQLMSEIRKLNRSSAMLHYAIAQKGKLNTTDAECIDFLMEMGPSTAGDLAKITKLTTGAITNVIDRLEKANVVRRESDPKDRRKVIIRLRNENNDVPNNHFLAMATDVFKFLSGYNEDQLQLLSVMTKEVTKIFEHHAELVSEH